MAVNAKQKKIKTMAPGERLAMVIGHPIRVKVLGILNRRMASPNEMAMEIGESLGLVSYHVTELKEEGCIELVKTEPRRGAVEHYYRANMPAYFDDEQWAKLAPDRRTEISALLLKALMGEVVGALNTGALDSRVDRVLGWTPFPVDEQGWRDVHDLLADLLERVEEIRGESAERLLAADEPGEQIVFAAMGFPRNVQS